MFAFTVLSHRSIASTYYFSALSGSDDYSSEQARNPGTPWKSLNKLNAYFHELNVGDSVLFKRGETFYGSIIAAKSGAVFAPIYFGAYGQGVKPQITGSSKLPNWKLVRPGIYESFCDKNEGNLIINGLQEAVGRYPNSGYLTYQSHHDNSSITDNELSDIVNWTNADIVIRKNRWTIDKSEITGQSAGNITYAIGNKAIPTDGYGYFIQNSERTLDQFGEWFFDKKRNAIMVYLGKQNPVSLSINVSTIKSLVNVTRYNYISFEDLTFTGSGGSAFNLVQAKKITLKNCNIENSGAEAVLASYSPFFSLQNCSINHALSGGVNLDIGCINSEIMGSTIKNIGLYAGMGKSGSGTYEGITSFGDNTRIEKNRIDSIGYNGIYFGGNSSIAKNNYITYFCLTKDDGAGIYIGDWSKTIHKRVIGNIIVHGVGNAQGGGSNKSLQAEGIYIDDNTESVFISNNTVSLCANNGIKIHNAKDINIQNNIVVNNGVQLRLEQDHYLATSTLIRNNQIHKNTFLSLSDLQATAKFTTHQDDINAFGELDSNFYYQPKKELPGIKTTVVKMGKGSSQNFDLARWKSVYGKDEFSTELPTMRSIFFEYNASNVVKTVKLNKHYVDVYNNDYYGKVVLEPYASIVLVESNQKPSKTAIIVDIKSRSSYLAAAILPGKTAIKGHHDIK
ncbi:right-handed parallel beta-helix repeat-containing protein [Mucilaginibacter sp. AW1-3]